MDYKLAKALSITGIDLSMLGYEYSSLAEIQNKNKLLCLAFSVRNAVVLSRHKFDPSERFDGKFITYEDYTEFLDLMLLHSKYFDKYTIREDWKLVNICTSYINTHLHDVLQSLDFTEEDISSLSNLFNFPLFKSRDEYNNLNVRRHYGMVGSESYNICIYQFSEILNLDKDAVSKRFTSFDKFTEGVLDISSLARDTYFIDTSNLGVLEIFSLVLELKSRKETSSIYLVEEKGGVINWECLACDKVKVISAYSPVKGKNAGDIVLSYLIGRVSTLSSTENIWLVSCDSDFSSLHKLVGNKFSVILSNNKNSISANLLRYYKTQGIRYLYVSDILGCSTQEYVAKSGNFLKDISFLTELANSKENYNEKTDVPKQKLCQSSLR